jgi:peptide/nickel transport system substrate-binding protein
MSDATLVLYGPGSMDHVDPACSSYALAGSVIRLYARTLFARPAGAGAVRPVPDAAAVLPAVHNGGISRDGRTYTIRLREGIRWDTTPVREVVAGDFVRGFKRMANPVAGTGWLTYFTSTVSGLAEFCRAYRDACGKGDRPANAAQLAEFQNTHEIPGMRAVDDKTVVFTLCRPANDFLDLLAMWCASAAPREYDAYVPGSAEFWTAVRSAGPYRLVEYEHGLRLRLRRNPAWCQASDPVRHQHLDGIDIEMAPVGTAAVAAEIAAGRADLGWGSPVVDETPAGALAVDDHPGFSHNPYLVLNQHSPRLRSRDVRRAIALAVDRTALVRLYEDLRLGVHARESFTAIPPGNAGYRADEPPPPVTDAPATCRRLLSAAGYPYGLTLTVLYRDADAHPALARSYADDLSRCGFEVDLVPVAQADYYRLLQDPANARAGRWDVTAVGWTPDWYGNNGRAAVQPLFQTDDRPGTANYGGYSSPTVDKLIDLALSEPDPVRAEELWHEVDTEVLRDVAIVPLVVTVPAARRLTSDRVRDAVAMADLDRWFDLAGIRLVPSQPA